MSAYFRIFVTTLPLGGGLVEDWVSKMLTASLVAATLNAIVARD